MQRKDGGPDRWCERHSGFAPYYRIFRADLDELSTKRLVRRVGRRRQSSRRNSSPFDPVWFGAAREILIERGVPPGGTAVRDRTGLA